jgi:hypothetical protein
VDQTVITEKQARQITGGRTPLVPVEYEAALNSLTACESLDEAQYWADKSDALAAWALIYRDDKAGRQARRLKIHAYRRMGILASEIRAAANKAKGASSLLIQHGLSKDQAAAAMQISRAPEKKLQVHIDAAHGINRTAASFRGLGSRRPASSDAWFWLADTSSAGTGPRLRGVWAALRAKSAKEVAAQIHPGEAQAARALLSSIQEWFDEFEQYLPPSNSESV